MTAQANAELAHNASDFWQSGKYKESGQVLKSLLNNLKKESVDGENESMEIELSKAKLDHNLALAKFAEKGSTDTESLLATFSSVLEEIKNCSAGNGSVDSSQDESGSASDAKREVIKSRFRPDSSFALYNQAVVFVFCKQWRSALDILEDLFRYIDAVDESVALCISFLLLDVYTLLARGSAYGDGSILLGHVVEKAQSVIDYLEKPHYFNGNQGVDSGASKGELSEDDQTSSSQSGTKNLSEQQIERIRKRLNSYKAKLILIQGTFSSAKVDSAELLPELLPTVDLKSDARSNTQNSDTVGEWEGLQLEKSEAPSFEGLATCLWANMKYLEGSYGDSLEMLHNAKAKGVSAGVVFNNLGCIHHMLGEYSIAATYFARAADFYEEQNESAASRSAALDVHFNLGVELLRCGHPKLAYDSFLKAVPCNYHRPRLWLHVAECVVLSCSQSLSKSGVNRSVLHSVSGLGANRRILLQPTQAEGDDDMLSLETGIRATSHALFLLNKAENESSIHGDIPAGSGIKPDSGSSSPLGKEAMLGSDVDRYRQQAIALKQSALLCRAYLAMWIDNYSVAYSACQQVLELAQKKLTTNPEIVSIAHTYSAEIMLRLHIDGQPDKKSTLEHIIKAFDLELHNNETLVKQRCAICVNSALIRLSKGEFEECERLLLRALEINPSSQTAIQILAYLCLLRGDQDRARRLLKTSR